jgi:hypothetical protein
MRWTTRVPLWHAEKCRDEIQKDKEFTWKFMDSYLGLFVEHLDSIENKTAARNAKDLANSPELKAILLFFSSREKSIQECKALMDIGKVRGPRKQSSTVRHRAILVISNGSLARERIHYRHCWAINLNPNHSFITSSHH